MSGHTDHPFSGSYSPEDVVFLLRPVEVQPLPVAIKEQRLLSGSSHYSEMLPEEMWPDEEWWDLVRSALDRHERTLGAMHRRLATAIGNAIPNEVVLVSLARAGTPTGAVIRRLLRSDGRQVVHYSVSLILQRGIDEAALDYIRSRHDDSAIVFVDGWTGKGSIAAELRASLDRYRASRGGGPPMRLAVLTDLAGVAQISVEHRDLLIPHALLGAVGAGLVSRSLLSDSLVAAGQFHACRFYGEWRSFDRSQDLLDRMTIGASHISANEAAALNELRTEHPIADAVLKWMRLRLKVQPRVVKLGLSESTRALLRRTPRLLFLQDESAIDVEHLILLADRSGVPIHIEADLPCQAAAIIRTADD